MAKKLVVIKGKDHDQDRVFPLPENGVLRIGRSADADMQLADLRVTRLHCEVEVADGQVMVRPDGDPTKHVTLVNDEQPTEQPLAAGDVIRVGDTELRLVDDDTDTRLTDRSRRPGGPKPTWLRQQLANPWVAILCLGTATFLLFMYLRWHGPGGDKTSTAPVPPNRPPRFALLVGVDDYGKQLPRFRHAEADVLEASRVLLACDYPPANVVTLSQNLGALDAGKSSPTAANIRQALHDLTEKRKPYDGLLLALVGHVVQFPGGAECYFCPADARLEDRQTLLPLTEIYKTLERWTTDTNLVLMDTCRETAPGDDAPPAAMALMPPRPQDIAPPKGVPVFFSCPAGQKGYCHLDARNGVFFHFVNRALLGYGDVQMTRRTTLDRLQEYVTSAVPQYVKRAVGTTQEPVMAGMGNPKLTLTDFGQSLFYFVEARGEYQFRRYPETVYYCNQVLAKTQYADAYLLRGTSNHQQHKLPAAQADLTRAIEMAPTHANAYAGRAEVQLQRGERVSAAADIQKAIQLDPSYGPFYAIRGAIALANRENEAAFADYDRALKLNPKLPRLLNSRGLAHLKVGNYEKAFIDFTEAARTAPEDATGLFHRGLVQEARKDPRQAIDEFTKALSVDREYGPAFYHRARMYEELAKDEPDADAKKKLTERATRDRDRAEALHYQPLPEEKP